MIEHLIQNASSFGRDVDFLFSLITYTVGFWFLVAQGVIFYSLFRFRRRQGVRASYITGNEKRQKRWISVPHFLVILCDVVLIVGTMKVWATVKIDIPEPDKEIRIIAQQWAWIFVQPGPDGKLDTDDDIKTVDHLHVEVDKTYRFQLQSRDVLHSFSVPSFRLKQDAIPGRTITGWFRPTAVGTFDIQCAEMCGIGHGVMAARIHIESAAEHEKWMKNPTPDEG